MSDKLIVDSGVAVKWVTSEPDSARAELIYVEHQTGNIEFLAPALTHAEIGNIVWKKQTLQGLSETNDAAALKKLGTISFLLTPTTALFDNAYRIAVTHKRSFYDSLYLALAERENCRFVTADERLYNAVRVSFPNVVLLANYN